MTSPAGGCWPGGNEWAVAMPAPGSAERCCLSSEALDRTDTLEVIVRNRGLPLP